MSQNSAFSILTCGLKECLHIFNLLQTFNATCITIEHEFSTGKKRHQSTITFLVSEFFQKTCKLGVVVRYFSARKLVPVGKRAKNNAREKG